MNSQDLNGLYKSYLHIERHIVGVKLVETCQAFDALNMAQKKNASYYCQMVKSAANGKSLKAEYRNFACETSAKILGLEPFYEEEAGIDGWYESGFYATRDVAKTEHQSVRPIPLTILGLSVAPLENYEEYPDILIIMCKPYQAMRLVQGYTYHFGYKKDFQLSGMCGVCFESTALPLTNREFTVSLLCSGTRFICRWPEDLMMVSFPFDMAEKILEGIVCTAPTCEPDKQKREIEHRLIHAKLEQHEIVKNNALTGKKGYFYRNDK